METQIQETDLYKSFIKALDIHDMRTDDNPFVVKCCKIAEEYASQLISKDPANKLSLKSIHDDPGIAEASYKAVNEMMNELPEVTYTLSCDNCEKSFTSKEAFPKPQLCDECKESKDNPEKNDLNGAEILIEQLKKDFSGSSDYLSGVNDGMYHLQRNLDHMELLSKKVFDQLKITKQPEVTKEIKIDIPLWQLQKIEDVLRQTSNIHHSQNKETCFDRCICKAWRWVRIALNK